MASEGRCCPLQAHARLLQGENDARRDLLLSLGVTVSAQERFIRTFVTRSKPGHDSASPAATSGGELSRGHSARFPEQCNPSPSSQSNRPAHLPSDPSSIYNSIKPQLSKCPVAQLLVPHLSNAATCTLAGGGGNAPSVLPSTPSQNVQPCIASSLSDDEPPFEEVRLTDPTTDFSSLSHSAAVQSSNLSHAADYSSDGTTACKIAASLIMTNNAIGCSAEELESRLRVGYLATGIANEDCRILNRVLFAVLAEISWAPP